MKDKAINVFKDIFIRT